MNLLEPLDPHFNIERGIILGLDTVITGDISDLLRYDGEFAVPMSPMANGQINNAVLFFGRTEADRIWQRWDEARDYWRPICSTGLGPNQNGRPSEVMFLRHCVSTTWDIVDALWPGKVRSYKCHDDWPEADVVYFHGEPKPPNVDLRLLADWV
jgi:hypothetical protein